ncbi:MAG: FeoB-associated Cys-rich membrane protein [Deltaproteobacteria bacterium]|nr:FeoB-associated Cys-rich membrane protein [Deltaproteobacteria bacterium]
MEGFIVAVIVALAVFLILRRFLRISKNESNCGCGCSGCAECPSELKI